MVVHFLLHPIIAITVFFHYDSFVKHLYGWFKLVSHQSFHFLVFSVLASRRAMVERWINVLMEELLMVTEQTVRPVIVVFVKKIVMGVFNLFCCLFVI